MDIGSWHQSLHLLLSLPSISRSAWCPFLLHITEIYWMPLVWWLGVCSCCSLTVLPGPAWILRWIYPPPYALSWSLSFFYSLKIIDSICSYMQLSYCCPAGTHVVTGERWRLLHFTAAGSLQAPPAVNISHFEMPRQAKRWRAGGRTRSRQWRLRQVHRSLLHHIYVLI